MQFVTLCNLQNALHNLGMVRIRGYGSRSRLEVGLGLGLGSDQQFANCACAISKLRILQTAQTDIIVTYRVQQELIDQTFLWTRHCGFSSSFTGIVSDDTRLLADAAESERLL